MRPDRSCLFDTVCFRSGSEIGTKADFSGAHPDQMVTPDSEAGGDVAQAAIESTGEEAAKSGAVRERKSNGRKPTSQLHPPGAAVASVEVVALHEAASQESFTLTDAIDQLSAKIEDKLNRKNTIADTKQG